MKAKYCEDEVLQLDYVQANWKFDTVSFVAHESILHYVSPDGRWGISFKTGEETAKIYKYNK